MFIEYDASKGIDNQEIKAEQVVLDFKQAHVKTYKELYSSVHATHGDSRYDSDLVKHSVHLCAIEIKVLSGCRVLWQGSDDSVVEASAARVRAGGISVAMKTKQQHTKTTTTTTTTDTVITTIAAVIAA